MIKAAEAKELAEQNFENSSLYNNIEKAINTACSNMQNMTQVNVTQEDFSYINRMIMELYKLGYSTYFDKDKLALFIHW